MEKRFGLERLCELAAEKDPGFRPSILADSLKGFYRLPRNEFDITDADFERLARAVERRTAALNKTEFTDGKCGLMALPKTIRFQVDKLLPDYCLNRFLITPVP